MRGLIWLLSAAALAVALALTLEGGSGYVQIVLPPWRVELSLVFAGLLLALAFLVLYALLRLVRHTLGLPAKVRVFRAQQRADRERRLLLSAVQALFEGRWSRAERFARDAHELGGEAARLARLVAARAAQRLRDPTRRDEWLARARADEGDWHRARLMIEAELLLEERRYEEARALLEELHASGARHIASLQLLLRAEQGLARWEEVIRLARQLEKRAALPPEAAETLVLQARVALFKHLAQDPARLAQAWRDTPESDRLRPRVAAAAARSLFQLGDCGTAHGILAEALDASWDQELVLLYGECRHADAIDRIRRAEAWLIQRPRDSDLLLTLGRLCAQCELWGKAQGYLEASLAVVPTRAVHLELATLMERTDRDADAQGHYRASADAGLRP